MTALVERGVTVGSAVVVAGHDDLAFSASLHPPPTTIRQPKRDTAVLKEETVIARATATDTKAMRRVLPSILVLCRSSTRG